MKDVTVPILAVAALALLYLAYLFWTEGERPLPPFLAGVMEAATVAANAEPEDGDAAEGGAPAPEPATEPAPTPAPEPAPAAVAAEGAAGDDAAADLKPADDITITAAFRAALQAEFPIGSPTTGMMQRLQFDGFTVNGLRAVYEHPEGACRAIWAAVWTDRAGSLQSIDGTFARTCP